MRVISRVNHSVIPQQEQSWAVASQSPTSSTNTPGKVQQPTSVLSSSNKKKTLHVCFYVSIRAAVLIQRWYRQYVARTEMRRRYTWHIFQSIEYSGEQAQIKIHGKRILKLLQKIFSWLPLATVIDQKVLVLHGGISDSTDLYALAKVNRHNRRASLTYPKPIGPRNCFHNRSLQEFSTRIKANMENELENSKRREVILAAALNRSHQDILSVSTDSVNSDNAKEEWRQVRELRVFRN
ncbi:hypothetical protein XENOCAPTIV_005739 [Xenoophorus captivus]|uniref:Calcineurin-like phosphoesterase domain-containing protein n=1 Tax=Xenoophorus captivus TaxID=1517983 RepID=A0ABV0RHA4_9TELE